MRKHKRQITKKIVEDIEKLRSENPKEYWKKLKELNNKEVEQNLPNKMKNENNEWIVDREGIAEIWESIWETRNRKWTEGKFGDKFAEEVRERIESKKQESKQQIIETILDEEIKLIDVNKVIKNLKRGKAVGGR